MSIEEFIIVAERYISTKCPPPDEPILYRIGDEVATRKDRTVSYVSTVIGTKVKGRVISECTVPLVDFGSIGTFYVCQKKLKLII